ncbi:hypothetical protein ACFY41_11735 [Streptomyces syringium]|uniref:hypothetical protein n=1 Tax=Streptomyces syringium TaxID=76729 RepID=UPI003684AA66
MTRLRAITTAAASAAMALAIAASGTASADAIGFFHYTYTAADGTEKKGEVHDQPDGECIDIEEAVADGTKPAHSPRNRTDKHAYLFEETDCGGQKFTVNADADGGANLKFRSIYFVSST